MSDKFYVTTPIYYVNDKPHIGHAYTTILADVLARYHRLEGTPTFFLTGTDEHGQKVQRAADKAGVTPQQQADTTVVRFQELWQRLGITHDDFIRTTESRHKVVVQRILQDLYDRDEIYRADYDGWYCVTCERFYTEKDIVDGQCPAAGCGRPVERIQEANYFFRMSKYQDWLVQHIEQHPTFIQPDYRRNETLGFLRRELQDLCISRPKSRMGWGIELPFDDKYVTYVWFDALVNYISGVGYLAGDDRFARWWPCSCHLIGKDILTTHTVYWPTMLQAMGLPQPEMIFAHGWWLVGRDKMSKTAGNVVNPMDFADKYGVDAFRYFLMSEMSLGQDASFTEEAFVRRYNADLANDLGNLLSRVMQMVTSYCGGKIPAPAAPGPEEEQLRDTTLTAVDQAMACIKAMRPDQGVAAMTDVVRVANRYLERRQPWTLGKTGKIEELGTVLYSAAEVLRIVAGMLYAVMPGKMSELRATLGLPPGLPDFGKLRQWGVLEPGAAVAKAAGLFPRIQPPAPDASAGASAAPAGVAPAASTATVSPATAPTGVVPLAYADFQKVHLRTAIVRAAERVPGADKLLKLQVEIGSEQRQIVAGIAKFYTPEELPGRVVVVVANLAPAKIRGVESNGMLLAATDGDRLRLITVDGPAPAGCKVS